MENQEKKLSMLKIKAQKNIYNEHFFLLFSQSRQNHTLIFQFFACLPKFYFYFLYNIHIRVIFFYYYHERATQILHSKFHFSFNFLLYNSLRLFSFFIQFIAHLPLPYLIYSFFYCYLCIVLYSL